MSFSQELKQSIAKIVPESKGEKKVELIALFALLGHYEDNKVFFETENTWVARKIVVYLKYFFKGKYSLKVQYKGQFKKIYYVLVAYVGKDSFLSKEIVFQNRKERASFLRGAFLARGSITDPKKGYHLELWCPSFPLYILLKQCLAAFSIEPKGITRNDHLFLYLKDAEMISDFLKVIGAIEHMFVFEETRVIKEIKNMTNRRNNCDLANLDKIIASSRKQIKSIKNIQKRGGIESLPINLREIAYLRLENPEASLVELGEMCDPVLKKSAVNYRMKKIESIGEKGEG